MKPRIATLLLLAALLPGCAELREPPPAERIPPGLRVAGDPVPVMALEVAAAFADNGRALVNNPAGMARAIGQFEIVAMQFRDNPRWAPLPQQVNSDISAARLEWRAVFGVRAGAAPEAVATALGRAALALRGGDTRAATAALDPALFDPGGAVTLARLAAPEPMPLTRTAAITAAQGVQRLERIRLGGVTGALDPDAPFLDSLTGANIPGTPRP